MSDPIGTGLSEGHDTGQAVDPRWHRFSASLSDDLPIPNVILESWQRCRSYGLVTAKTAKTYVGEAEATARLARNRELVEVAKPHLLWLSTAVAMLPFHCVMLADSDGIILNSRGNRPDAMDLFGLRCGYDWSEQAMGTNGIGTALATERPVAVVGDAHYLDVIHNYTCVGAAINGPDGEVLGVLDLCTAAADGDPGRLVLVAYAARTIAQELTMRGQSAGLLSDRVAFVAHELATPLSSLSLLSRRLMMAAEPTSPMHDLAVRFHHQLRRLGALLDGLLEASSKGARTCTSTDAPMPLDELLRDIASDFHEIGESTGRPVEVRAKEAFVATWDRRKWLQIVTNLIANAYKYGKRGPIEIDVERRGDVVCVVVSDHGPGVPESERQAIFERWVRGTREKSQSGSGLGLWIASELVASLGGTITVEGELGVGASFVVSVPFPTRTS